MAESGRGSQGECVPCRWEATESLLDQACLVSGWLRGDLWETPGHLGPPVPETAPLLPSLLTLNGCGLVTTGSQPARVDDRCKQRPYVELYGPADLVNALRDDLRQAGYLATTWHMHWATTADQRDPSPGIDVTWIRSYGPGMHVATTTATGGVGYRDWLADLDETRLTPSALSEMSEAVGLLAIGRVCSEEPSGLVDRAATLATDLVASAFRSQLATHRGVTPWQSGNS